ncbi:MAG: STAS domain-containing protein [Chromatiales bacterium]|jgi:anti-anti-sigma factor
MSVTASQSGDTVTIVITGRFDFSAHQDFVNSYSDLPKGKCDFVVDMTGAEYMDSSAMGMLLQLREYANKDNRVQLKNTNSSIQEILKIANFDKLFDIR